MSRKFNKIFLTLMTAVLLAAGAHAEGRQFERFNMSDLNIAREGETLNASWTLNPAAFRLKTGEVVRVGAVVRSVETDDSVVIAPVTVAGKNAWYSIVRNNNMVVPADLYRSGSGEGVPVSVSLPWQPWMENSMVVGRIFEECCGEPEEITLEEPIVTIDLREREIEAPLFIATDVKEGPKTRSLAGRAYINFPVNRTEIYPDYMRNPFELRKILNTIDSVRLNPDFTVRGIWLTGYASPEGPYANNVRLAKGRTEALKEYVRKQYSFPESIFTTNSVPEDWGGLREAVEQTALPDRQEIIAFIDDTEIPIEVKNDRLRARFPKTYPFLLKEIYPSLRHTDYEIAYEIRSYTDVEEIKVLVKTAPQQLSLGELMRAAASYGAGTPEADEVMEVAVRMFPNDEQVNLNVAVMELKGGRLDRAAQYLEKAGQSGQADWARGVLAAKRGDMAAAEGYLLNAQGKGVDVSKALETVRNRPAGIVIL